ncbi:N-acetylglucosamine-6-phosphate deacetylase [Motiliproteus sp. MSK22-1]|uniref:N-acetylglucosamine-6-phosphate deacetylase n=1 Tax=Motiliproteus sp. MSK22-1 TaxID=1897630 RepID=UPI0009754E5A|nr:N-acetylglucosamine-6-phosphate deacetylase [Motiliproteus sp. MSK22-1]OMH33889.1 N-acetylglucosamine-6-phosphate deacetylase [Motiliproteus sp. MSK22-1]
MAFALTECRIFTGECILDDHAVIIKDGRINKLLPSSDLDSSDFNNSPGTDSSLRVYRLNGELLAPGYIDTQVNGGADVLFNDAPSVDSIRAIGAAHRRFGTTAFLPTLISDSREKMEAALAAANQAMTEQVPGCLGVHLEGPFLNLQRKGVHPEAMIRRPEADAQQLLTSLKRGKTLVTLAPEQIPDGFIHNLVESGVIVAAGHTAATYDQVRHALSEGLTGFTHLFNAMPPLNSREPGAVGAALEDNKSWCGLIVDNHHVHPATLKIAINAKPRGGMMLVTDAVQTVGSENNDFELLGQKIVRQDGRVSTAEGTLAGSDLDMASAVRNCVQILDLTLEESLRMASLYPARFLGLASDYGRIGQGFKASMVLLDKDLRVRETWIDGVSSKEVT